MTILTITRAEHDQHYGWNPRFPNMVEHHDGEQHPECRVCEEVEEVEMFNQFCPYRYIRVVPALAVEIA